MMRTVLETQVNQTDSDVESGDNDDSLENKSSSDSDLDKFGQAQAHEVDFSGSVDEMESYLLANPNILDRILSKSGHKTKQKKQMKVNKKRQIETEKTSGQEKCG